MKIKQANRLEGVPLTKIRDSFYKCAALVKQGRKLTQFTLGQPDFDTPEYIKDACKKALDDGFTGYADNDGIEPLRTAIADKLRRENGLNYDPDEIMVTMGVAQGAFVALLSFLNPGDEILVPEPVYSIYTAIPKIAGAVVKSYKLEEKNNFQIDLDELRELTSEKTKMLVLVSPSNPIGSILTGDNLRQVAKLAQEKDLLVVSDEIYERLTYDEDEIISIASFEGMKERTIVLNGLSKCMSMTGWRIGYMAAPTELIEPMNRLSFYMTAGPVSFIQHAAVTALRDDDGSVEKMRLEFKKRRDYFVSEINKMKQFSCLLPKGAFYVFLNIKKTGMKSEEFCDYLLDNYSVATIPGSAFGENGEGYVRFSYAASLENLKEAVRCLNLVDEEFSRKA